VTNHLVGMTSGAAFRPRSLTISGSTLSLLLLIALSGCGIPSGSSPEEVGGSKAAADAGERYGSSLQRGIDRGKRDKTLGDLRSASRVLEQYHVDQSAFPEAGSCAALGEALAAYRGLGLQQSDPWGSPYQCRSWSGGYSLRSAGEDRQAGTGDDLVAEGGSP
jgi:hypothetical protein